MIVPRPVPLSMVIALSVSLLGCSSRSNQPTPTYSAEQTYFTHTVQYQGETLANIAKWYTGVSGNWMVIRDANPELNPRRLKMGSTVLIPQNLVVHSEPFPKPKASSASAQGVGSDNGVSLNDPRSTAKGGASADNSTAPPSEIEGTPEPEIAAAPPEPPVHEVDASNYDVSNLPPLVPDAAAETGNNAPSVEAVEAPKQGGDTTQGVPSKKGGIVDGLLEAVGQASLESKKESPAKTAP